MYPIICEHCGILIIPGDGILIRTHRSDKGRFCGRHYNQLKKFNSFKDDFQYSRYSKNPYTIENDFIKFALFDKNGNFKDFGFISLYDKYLLDYKWCIANTGYIYNYDLGNMHKIILKDGIIDHANRNKLDNRRENLRVTTTSKNASNSKLRTTNTSGVIGVSWHKLFNCWRARLKTKDVELCELFSDFNDAIKQRLLWEREYLGDFAPQKHLFAKYLDV